MAKGRQTPFTTRVVWFLVFLFLLITIVSQLVIHFYNPLKTESARLYSTSAYIPLTGVYVRNETLVTYGGSGVISYVHSDGEKLGKSSVIAKIYSSQEDLRIQREIDALNQQIEILTDAESLIGSDNSQLEAFSNQIFEKHSQLMQYIGGDDFSGAADMKEDILNLWCKKQIVNGTTSDYSEKISELESQIVVLKAKISADPQNLTLDETGYFVSKVDGFETTLNYDSVSSLTEARINEIVANPYADVADNVIGKIISDYRWKLVCVIDGESAKKVFEGAQIDIRLGSSSEAVSAVIDSMEKDEGTGNVVMTLSCDILNSSFVGSRTVQFKILLDDYSGIRIPSSAIRFDEDGNAGVYVKMGVEISFKKIRVIINEGDYAIIEDTTSENGYLSLYDTVVTEGTDLYDGKIVLQ